MHSLLGLVGPLVSPERMAAAAVSRAELARHGPGAAGGAWIALHGLVYDVAEYLPDHPGGGEIVELAAGRDATQEFEEALHSSRARREPRVRLKGVLEGCEDLVADLRARGWREGRGVPFPEQLLPEAPAAGGSLPQPSGQLLPLLPARCLAAAAVAAAAAAVVGAWAVARRRAAGVG
mmetsp:Transcript_154038/g.473460  ORF Transcript_154038/g.473460 Transcript_154038/m.473460 type:complete len:178 (-) Transcript_154038:20-553(-)